MKKNIVALVMLCSSVAALAMSAPAQAGGMGNSSVGPSLLINNGATEIGIDSKFGISDNISIRPSVYFPNGGTRFGANLTYDFDVSRSSKLQITPYLGGGFLVTSSNGGGSVTQTLLTGGADFGISDSVDLKAALIVPLSSNNSTTAVSLGAGFKF